ncbi:MAG: vitamin K-dependent gamma-carboxylase [Cognaticolwellia sp.]|jgi:vitamin K-dependent gamma-carboxylase
MTGTEFRLRAILSEVVDPAGWVLFRVGFGLLAAAGALRFVLKGWVQELLLEPSFHFAWVSWAKVPSPAVLYGLFALQIIAGLGIAWGRGTRAFTLLWLLSFGYVELLDKALYLNHYVLFTLMGLWLLVSPPQTLSGPGLPRWSLWLMRAQVLSVYVWAGLAKLNTDWLMRGEPLQTWLGARAGLPVIGPLLAQPETALAMSWGGACYDLSIGFLLLHPKSRPLAVVLLIAFHVGVGLLFPIGLFPWLMVLGASALFAPDWPGRWMGSWEVKGTPPPLRRGPTILLVGVITFLSLFPARGLLTPGNSAWTEQGYRFSWKVMLNEKTGLVEYRVHQDGKTWKVYPAQELGPIQYAQLRTQPDLIRDYALHLQARHGGQAQVYAESWASLNGHPTQRLIDPALDLTLPYSTLQERGWILPLESQER